MFRFVSTLTMTKLLYFFYTIHSHWIQGIAEHSNNSNGTETTRGSSFNSARNVSLPFSNGKNTRTHTNTNKHKYPHTYPHTFAQTFAHLVHLESVKKTHN